MIRRLITLAAFLLVLGASTPAHPSAAVIYNAVADYDYLVNTNTSTWSYRYDPNPTTRSAAEPLLTVPNSEYLGGSTTTTGWTFATGFNPGILKSTADEFRLGQINIRANKLYAAPNLGLGGNEVLSWLAPGPGTVDISFDTGAAQHGGDYLWFVDKNGSAGNLASGHVLGYPDTDSANLSGVPVLGGDRINFAFDENGAAAFDALEFTAEIVFTPQVIPEPSSLPLAVLSVISAAIRGRRRRLAPEGATHSAALGMASVFTFDRISWKQRKIVDCATK